ncbi:MAG: CdaR family protein [Desulfovibrio sp.]|uniref:CdaR family protein n=1 Tax=Desulfovibrio sp. TaxID=885 RepID=UPI002A372271|nr:CdaR family protein [Desulfovibrio sp.]MDY0259705.1 CdaR family protein [Desulfovibrio sp.]
MTSSRLSRRSPHLMSMLVAVLAAVSMWYVVSVRDRVEAQLEVTLDYYGIPANLVITDGLINKVLVRLRGPETLLRSVTQGKLIQAVDLSHIKKGVTVVPLTAEHLGPGFRAFELIDVQPPRIVVKADNLIERSVPVRVAVGSSLSNGALTVENVSVTPANVTLRGPEAMVEDIASVPVPIQADPKAAGSTVQQVVTLDTPGLVTPIPPTVKVQYSITSGRAEVTRSCKVEVLAENHRQFTVTPAEVSVHIEVPEALVKNAQYLKQLEATVSPPDMAEGESRKVEIRFRLPEGMTLLNPGTEEVTISRKKK